MYKIREEVDGYDFLKEMHYTETKEREGSFGDVFNFVDMSFGGNKEDYVSEIVDNIPRREVKQKVKHIEFKELETDTGTLNFKVETDVDSYEIEVIPTVYHIDANVSEEEIIEQDNDKLEQAIMDYLDLDNENLKELVEEGEVGEVPEMELPE